jgi:hypothetical protein
MSRAVGMAQEGAGRDPTHLRPPREYSCDGSHFPVGDDLARKVLGVLSGGAAVWSSFPGRGRLRHGVTQVGGSYCVATRRVSGDACSNQIGLRQQIDTEDSLSQGLGLPVFEPMASRCKCSMSARAWPWLQHDWRRVSS